MAGNGFVRVPGGIPDTAGEVVRQDYVGGAALVSVSDIVLLAGEDQNNDVLRVEQQFLAEAVAASQTDQIMGATGAVGDFLHRVIIAVDTSATGTCSIKDGNGSAMPLTAANTPIGVYSVEVNASCVNATTPGWRITTGAGCTVIGVGRFT